MAGTHLQTFPPLVSCKRNDYVRVRLKASTQPVISPNLPGSAAPSNIILNRKWAAAKISVLCYCDGQVVSHQSYVWGFDFHLFLSALKGRTVGNNILVSLKGFDLKMSLIHVINWYLLSTCCMHEYYRSVVVLCINKAYYSLLFFYCHTQVGYLECFSWRKLCSPHRTRLHNGNQKRSHCTRHRSASPSLDQTLLWLLTHYTTPACL